MKIGRWISELLGRESLSPIDEAHGYKTTACTTVQAVISLIITNTFGSAVNS